MSLREKWASTYRTPHQKTFDKAFDKMLPLLKKDLVRAARRDRWFSTLREAFSLFSLRFDADHGKLTYFIKTVDTVHWDEEKIKKTILNTPSYQEINALCASPENDVCLDLIVSRNTNTYSTWYSVSVEVLLGVPYERSPHAALFQKPVVSRHPHSI